MKEIGQENRKIKSKEEVQDDDRDIFLYGEINVEKIKEISTQLIKINNKDIINLEINKEYKPKPIKIYINSGGGDYYASISLARLISNLEASVETVCYSFAASGAFIVFISGDKRILHEDAILMHHDVFTSCCDYKTTDIQNEAKLMKRLRDSMSRLIKEKTNITQQVLDEIYNTKEDKFFTIDEVKNFKLADRIIH